jgi:hypothetical protein
VKFAPQTGACFVCAVPLNLYATCLERLMDTLCLPIRAPPSSRNVLAKCFFIMFTALNELDVIFTYSYFVL